MVLGIALIGLLLVDHLQDGDFRQIGKAFAHPTLVVTQLIFRNFFQRLVVIGLQIGDAAVFGVTTTLKY